MEDTSKSEETEFQIISEDVATEPDGSAFGEQPDIGSDTEDAGGLGLRNLSLGSKKEMPLPLHGLSKLDPNANYYSMEKRPRGHCLIFNHVNFDAALGMNPRKGSVEDAKAIQRVFTKLGFYVHVFEDLDYNNLTKTLDLYSLSVDHSEYDCLAVFFLSHGEQGSFFCKDRQFSDDLLFQAFEAKNCPSLAGKPKMFFIQACRGQKLEDGVAMYVQTDGPATYSHKLPSTADFFVFWSTVPGYYSWRNTYKGSWFIQSLTHVFEHLALTHDLGSLHSVLNRHMILNFQSNTPSDPRMNEMKQCCMFTSTATRLMHFSPPKDA